jgi:putative transposase
MRRVKFENDNYYHIYNRGVDKREIFLDERDFSRFIKSIRNFNNTSTFAQRLFVKNRQQEAMEAKKELSSKVLELSSFLAALPKLVEIICYCLNPNHYHFILKQLIDNGIEIFMHKLGTGYTNYFNAKYSRSGSLFEGPFKSKHINSASYLAWLSGYVNGNSEIHKIAKAKNHKWSSCQDYLGLRNGTLCNRQIIINEFSNNISEYEKFVEIVVKDSREKKESIKEYLAELES